MEGIVGKHIDYEINKELGECYLFMGEYEKAREYYNKAVACDVGYAATYLGMATIAMPLANGEEAKLFYSTALELGERDKPYHGLGLALTGLGQEGEGFESSTASPKLPP